MRRFFAVIIILMLVTTAVWSKQKDKHDPQALIAKSDAVYYYPAAHGLNDMAVDLRISQLLNNKDTKDIKVTYYYAGENRQQFDISNLSAAQEDLRPKILALVDQCSDYLMPKTCVASFKGLKLKSEQESRQLLGDPETAFYRLIGTAPDKNAQIKELRVLFDKQGLIRELENLMNNGTPVTARVENIRVGDQWQISKISTRVLTDSDPQWRIVIINYMMVDGFSLPAHIIMQQRSLLNQPIGDGDLDIQFTNYRLNKGAAAEFLPKATEAPHANTPQPPVTPAPPAPAPAPPAAPPTPAAK